MDGIFCVAGGWTGGNAKKGLILLKETEVILLNILTIYIIYFRWSANYFFKFLIDLVKNSEMMWQQSVCSSLIAGSLAASYLKEGGVLQLTGAKAALDATPGNILII